MIEKIWNSTHILKDILNDLNGMFYRCRYDEHWTMLFVTDGCEQLTGYKPEELLYNSVCSYGALIHPEDHPRINLICDELVRKKEHIVVEYRIIDKYGSVKRVWEKAAAIYDHEGNVLFIEGYIVEADERKNRQELNNELKLYRQAIDINLITSITDRRGKILFVNKKFCDISGYSELELIGANHNIVNSGFHPKEFFADLWNTITEGKVWHGEILNKSKTGRFYWVDTVIIPILNEKGKVKRYFSIRLDITERKEAEEKNRQHIRAMEKMLHMISHELRQPVTTALGLIQLIDTANALQQDELPEVLLEVKSKVQEIEMFTRKLTNYIHEHKILRE